MGSAFHEHLVRCRTLGQTMIEGYLGIDWTIDPIVTHAINGDKVKFMWFPTARTPLRLLLGTVGVRFKFPVTVSE